MFRKPQQNHYVLFIAFIIIWPANKVFLLWNNFGPTVCIKFWNTVIFLPWVLVSQKGQPYIFWSNKHTLIAILDAVFAFKRDYVIFSDYNLDMFSKFDFCNVACQFTVLKRVMIIRNIFKLVWVLVCLFLNNTRYS